MFETHTPPPRFHQRVEALSVFILTRHTGNPCFECKCKLVLGTTKGHLSFISDEAEQVPGPDRVRCSERRTLASPPPPFIVPHSLPNHHSQYPTGASLTLNICPTLPL